MCGHCWSETLFVTLWYDDVNMDGYAIESFRGCAWLLWLDHSTVSSTFHFDPLSTFDPPSWTMNINRQSLKWLKVIFWPSGWRYHSTFSARRLKQVQVQVGTSWLMAIRMMLYYPPRSLWMFWKGLSPEHVPLTRKHQKLKEHTNSLLTDGWTTGNMPPIYGPALAATTLWRKQPHKQIFWLENVQVWPSIMTKYDYLLQT